MCYAAVPILFVNMSFYFSALFVDEDGDAAHEFYEETDVESEDDSKRKRLDRVRDNLKPKV